MTGNGCTSMLEDGLLSRGYRLVGGVDEVGRGALAGPVVAACVIPGKDFGVTGIRDSKKITPRKREKLFDEIHSAALAVGVGIVGPDEIDKWNILRATLKAMKIAILSCAPQPDYLLIDGDRGLEIDVPLETVVGGDDISVSIGAASIVAKVTRDRIMVEYSEQYPEYGFAGHKGYGTSGHIRSIEENGPCNIHRLSFSPICQPRQGELFGNSGRKGN